MSRIFFLFFLLSLGCVSEVEKPIPETATSIWYVPEIEISGGTSEFPLIENPNYSSINQVELLHVLGDNSKLSMLKIDGVVYAYPYDFTNYYEVINLQFGDLSLALTYCPNTKSAVCFNRKLDNGIIVRLKASGYLYKENQVILDVDNEQYWSQMTNKIIRGNVIQEKLKTKNIVETTWIHLKNNYPNAQVFNHTNVGNTCDTNTCDIPNPELDYSVFFGVLDNNLTNEVPYLFNLNDFENGIETISLQINGKNTLVVGSKNKFYTNAFYIPVNLNLIPLEENEFPLILTDNEGNKWDIFGHAMQGPRIGDRLDTPNSYIALPWAWQNFCSSVNQ